MGISTFITICGNDSENHLRTVARQLQRKFTEPATGGIGRGNIRSSRVHKDGFSFEVPSQELSNAMQIINNALKELEILGADVKRDPTFMEPSSGADPIAQGVLVTLKP